jgi:hypothetical protein
MCVLTPVELLASKIESMVGRAKTAKGLMDAPDIPQLLFALPDLKTPERSVTERLQRSSAPAKLLKARRSIVAEDIRPDDEHDEL